MVEKTPETPLRSEQDPTQLSSASSDPTKNNSSQDSDDEPMVYSTPNDYSTWAQQERARMISSGFSPSLIVLQSEVKNHVLPFRDNESHAEFAKRYVDTMNEMISRGVHILNDVCTADMKGEPCYDISDGRHFYVGEGSGATKREYREFGKWWEEWVREGRKGEVPERWMKFLKSKEVATESL